MDSVRQRRDDIRQDARPSVEPSDARRASSSADLDEVERILWEDLQRIFWTDVQDMQHASSVARKGSVPATAPPICAETQGQPTHKPPVDAHSPVRYRSGDEQHPTRRTIFFPRRSMRSQQQPSCSSARSPNAPSSARRSVVSAFLLFLVLWLFLAFLLIPIAIWAANVATGTEILYRHPLHHTFNDLNPFAWMGSRHEDPSPSTHGAFSPSFSGSAWNHEASIPSLQQDGDHHVYHRHAYVRPPAADKPSPTEYAPNSAWSLLNRGRFQVPASPPVAGRPVPVVWLCRYHVELWETLDNSTHRLRRESS